MSDFWSLEPEVAGELGDGSVLDTSVHPPIVSKLEYILSGWLGDDLLESFPCYVVTERLAKELQASACTGYRLDDVEVVTSPEFDDMYPERQLPGFRWLKITGKAGVDDFGMSAKHTLVVSDRALQAMRRHTLDQCGVGEFDG
ncbi:MAG: hypothetical protein MUC36_09615 [Planctomycetes bacterium]|jgi:hypothetical protein|nr:hypothetical protein [Planctomycetota bacterium]